MEKNTTLARSEMEYAPGRASGSIGCALIAIKAFLVQARFTALHSLPHIRKEEDSDHSLTAADVLSGVQNRRRSLRKASENPSAVKEVALDPEVLLRVPLLPRAPVYCNSTHRNASPGWHCWAPMAEVNRGKCDCIVVRK